MKRIGNLYAKYKPTPTTMEMKRGNVNKLRLNFLMKNLKKPHIKNIKKVIPRMLGKISSSCDISL